MEMALVAARRAVWTLCLCIAQGAFVDAVAGQNIAIVMSENTAIYIEVADAVKRFVNEQTPPKLKLITMPAEDLASGEREIFKTDFYSLVITIGARAAGIVANLAVKPPVLNTLIPRALYEQLPPRQIREQSSAIYFDQPLARQLELARLILPGKNRLGMVYGPKSASYWAELEPLAKSKGYVVVAESFARQGEFGPMFERVFARADFLFALPDAEIFNRATISKILLSSYHSRRPIIAFSAAHVKSGALAALFTPPEALARHIADVLAKQQADGKFLLPPPQYPAYWRVSVNRQVAHSLGLSLPDDEELHNKLSQAPEDLR